MIRISVLMSVYQNDNPIYFEEALLSIWDNQKLKPYEIVLIQDGEVSDNLSIIIYKWKERLGSKLILLINDFNIGLTKSLNKGLKLCKGDFIARMDSDDISVPSRFEIQSNFLLNNTKVDLLGCYNHEFSTVKDFNFIREYPLKSEDIKKTMIISSPMCHASVMFRKKIFDEGNSYNEKYSTSQDIALWFELFYKGYKFANINKVLYKARLSEDFHKRRSYKKALYEFQIYWKGIIKLFGYTPKLVFPIFRLFVRLMPTPITKLIYYSNIRKILN